MKELWRHMVNHPDLLISNYGNIKRESTGHIFPKYINHGGYYYCSLCDQGKKFVAKCHREVAKAFIENIDNKPCVNHKDGNKLNNNVDNLEWCTYRENSIHSIYTLGNHPMNWEHKTEKPVQCIETGIVYKSCKAAYRAIGSKSHGHIESCCKDVRKTHNGFHWKYI